MTRQGVVRWFRRRLTLLAALAALASLCAALSKHHWFLELFSHFAVHYAASALVLAIALAALRSWRPAVLALAVAGWNVFVVAEAAALFETPDARAAGPRLTVFHFNAAYRHPHPDSVIDYVLAHAERIDVVVLIEATSRWREPLRRLQARFPHAAQELDDSPFGIAVLSRLPAESVIADAPNGYRHAELRISRPGASRPIALYAVHPPPPMSGDMADARNDKLAHVARAIRERSGETAIVVGDFNLTPYSPHFAAFVRDSGLRPVQSTVVPRNTWPVILGSAWLGIPIDHSFVGREARVVSHEIGPDLGSDHLPVTLSIALP